MSSRKESQELRTLKSTKQMAQNRRNILRVGALGAVAVLAANVLPGSDVRAATEQAETRSVAKQGAQGRSRENARRTRRKKERLIGTCDQAVRRQGRGEDRQVPRRRAPGWHPS